MDQSILLFAPEFALEEINKYEKEIIRKAKITKEEFLKHVNVGIEVEIKLNKDLNNFSYGYISRVDVYFYHDDEEDVEYFYAD